MKQHKGVPAYVGDIDCYDSEEILPSSTDDCGHDQDQHMSIEPALDPNLPFGPSELQALQQDSDFFFASSAEQNGQPDGTSSINPSEDLFSYSILGLESGGTDQSHCQTPPVLQELVMTSSESCMQSDHHQGPDDRRPLIPPAPPPQRGDFPQMCQRGALHVASLDHCLAERENLLVNEQTQTTYLPKVTNGSWNDGYLSTDWTSEQVRQRTDQDHPLWNTGSIVQRRFDGSVQSPYSQHEIGTPSLSHLNSPMHHRTTDRSADRAQQYNLQPSSTQFERLSGLTLFQEAPWSAENQRGAEPTNRQGIYCPSSVFQDSDEALSASVNSNDYTSGSAEFGMETSQSSVEQSWNTMSGSTATLKAQPIIGGIGAFEGTSASGRPNATTPRYSPYHSQGRGSPSRSRQATFKRRSSEGQQPYPLRHIRSCSRNSSNDGQYLRPPSSTCGGPTSPSASTVSATSSVPESLVCETCGHQFTGGYRKGNFQRHIRLKHGQKEKTYPCEDPVCANKRPFKRKDARLKHYRKYHPQLASELVPRRLY